MYFEQVMEKLHEFIKKVKDKEEKIEARPVGVWFDEQGRIVVKWNNLHNDYVDTLNEAAEIIETFLAKQNVVVLH